MRQETIQTKFVALMVGLLLFALLAPFVVSPQIAYAKDGGSALRYQGFVQSKPSTGFVGTWVIGGKTFKATTSTQINQADGKLVVGACAKVKYQVVSGQNQALEIDSQPPSDCR